MEERKINLEEIIEELDFSNNVQYDVNHNGYSVTMYTKDAIKIAMLEFGKQLLELAAEKAEIDEIDLYVNDDGLVYKSDLSINKQTIINTIDYVK